MPRYVFCLKFWGKTEYYLEGIWGSIIERTLTANKRAKASAQFKLIFEDTGSMPDFSSTVPVERSQKARTDLIAPEIVEDDGKSEPINHLIVGGLQSALKPLQRESTADANQARRLIFEALLLFCGTPPVAMKIRKRMRR